MKTPTQYGTENEETSFIRRIAAPDRAHAKRKQKKRMTVVGATVGLIAASAVVGYAAMRQGSLNENVPTEQLEANAKSAAHYANDASYPSFEELDANNDKLISQSEYLRYIQGRFNEETAKVNEANIPQDIKDKLNAKLEANLEEDGDCTKRAFKRMKASKITLNAKNLHTLFYTIDEFCDTEPLVITQDLLDQYTPAPTLPPTEAPTEPPTEPPTEWLPEPPVYPTGAPEFFTEAPHFDEYPTNAPHQEEFFTEAPHIDEYFTEAPHHEELFTEAPHIDEYFTEAPHHEESFTEAPHIDEYFTEAPKQPQEYPAEDLKPWNPIDPTIEPADEQEVKTESPYFSDVPVISPVNPVFPDEPVRTEAPFDGLLNYPTNGPDFSEPTNSYGPIGGSTTETDVKEVVKDEAQTQTTVVEDPVTGNDKVIEENPATGETVITEINSSTGEEVKTTIIEENQETGEKKVIEENAETGEKTETIENTVTGEQETKSYVEENPTVQEEEQTKVEVVTNPSTGEKEVVEENTATGEKDIVVVDPSTGEEQKEVVIAQDPLTGEETKSVIQENPVTGDSTVISQDPTTGEQTKTVIEAPEDDQKLSGGDDLNDVSKNLRGYDDQNPSSNDSKNYMTKEEFHQKLVQHFDQEDQLLDNVIDKANEEYEAISSKVQRLDDCIEKAANKFGWYGVYEQAPHFQNAVDWVANVCLQGSD